MQPVIGSPFVSPEASLLELAQLPLVLAGPVLRRTTPQAVTVWLALGQACRLELRVLATAAAGKHLGEVQLRGQASTVRLGPGLHVVAITARSSEQSASPVPGRSPDCDSGSVGLVPGQLYAYDLAFELPGNAAVGNGLEEGCYPGHDPGSEPIALRDAVRSPRFPGLSLSYFAHGLPTFSLCPTELEQLKIFHGSCRKLQDRNEDALPIVDAAIAAAADRPDDRPHQLFFTGDQIYGDEVAEPLLWAIGQIERSLLGWQEPLQATVWPDELQPGQRSRLATQVAGLTSGLQQTPQKASSHLFRLGEYCVTYLLSWSQCLWPNHWPSGEAMGRQGKAARVWDEEVAFLQRQRRSQPWVRRALANVPTYMIFDDHDVSDDWNLNLDWCQRVFSRPLGHQVVRNALWAYSLFQGWGNTPEQFVPGEIGHKLLQATAVWCRSGGRDAQVAQTISQCLGLPDLAARSSITGSPPASLFWQDGQTWRLRTAPGCLRWHYRIQGTVHDVIVLDTRTQRGYPLGAEPKAVPALLSPLAFDQQVRVNLQQQQQRGAAPAGALAVTLVVAPTNVFTLELLDWVQRLAFLKNTVFDADVGDSWNLEGATRAKLLNGLFESQGPVVILSGDIHFGASIKVCHWARFGASSQSQRRSLVSGPFPRRFGQGSDPQAETLHHSLVQLTASAICNSETITGLLHSRCKALLPERSRHWIGWETSSKEVEVSSRWLTALRYWRAKLWCWFGLSHRLSSDEMALLKVGSPDWGYSTDWLRRQPARQPDWIQGPAPWLGGKNRPARSHQGLFRRLWYGRWLQEGPEVVGVNNIALIQFEFSAIRGRLGIIHDIHWYAPWCAQRIVYSRFTAEIQAAQEEVGS